VVINNIQTQIQLKCVECGATYVFELKLLQPKFNIRKLKDLFYTFAKSGLKRFYRGSDKHCSEGYKKGRRFEYAIMGFLRRRIWHCNRRFGSIGVIFCNKCLNEVSRKKPYYCKKCKTGKHVVKASLDVTAYKGGLYLMISAKYRKRGAVVYDDKEWKNLVVYATKFNAIPVFCGNNKNGKMYFVDLRTQMPLDVFYQHKKKRVDKTQMSQVIQEAWKTLRLCNRVLGESEIECPKCKHLFKVLGADVETLATQGVKWVKEKINAINVLQRCLWRAGETKASTDITELFTNNFDIPKEEGGEK